MLLDMTRAMRKFRRETGIRDPKIDHYVDPLSAPLPGSRSRGQPQVSRTTFRFKYPTKYGADTDFDMRYKYTTIGLIVPRPRMGIGTMWGNTTGNEEAWPYPWDFGDKKAQQDYYDAPWRFAEDYVDMTDYPTIVRHLMQGNES